VILVPFRSYGTALSFFFFQAEDGIRDRNVTGVQTCALPISRGPALGRRGTGHRDRRPRRARRLRRCSAERGRDDRGDGGGTEHVGLRLVRTSPGRLLGRRAAHLHSAERCDRRAIMTSPTVLETFLWVIIPYMALAVFVLGHIWRFRRDRFGWTSRSSQIYESKLLRIGSPLFHYGIIFVFLGHVIGLGIPK